MRTKRVSVLFGACAILLLPRAPRATEETATPESPVRLNPLAHLGTSLARSFWGANLALHVVGVGTTPVLIGTGIDTKVHNFWVEHEGFSPYTVPGVVGGYFAPLLLGAGLAGTSLLTASPRTTLAANAVLQSLMVSFTYQALLKTVTGRKSPDPVHYDDNVASRQFQFGFLRNGIDWGWPSGLLLTNTAALVSLAYVYPESWPLRIVGAAAIAYLFVSASAHEEAKLCWFSDAVAGLAMGLAIGRGVGASLTGQGGGLLDRVALTPMLGESRQGIVATLSF